jgi:DnaJ like chaperone protein
MSLWGALLERLEPIRLDLRKRFLLENPTSHVDFSIAFIALAAKLAKADGQVSRSEVAAFRQVMDIPASEEARVGRIYDLCRRGTDGYETYAARISRLLRGHPSEGMIRENLIDGLFHIAMADGVYHPAEDRFLRVTADRLGLDEEGFDRIRSRHVPDAWDPYRVLGLSRTDGPDKARAAWKRLVRVNHPDLLHASGLPFEMRLVAEARMRDINRAYEELAIGDENDPQNANNPCI